MPKLRAASPRRLTLLLLALTSLSVACKDDQATAKDADATLSAITFSGGTLAPAFDPARESYFLTVPYGTPSVTATPTAASPGATIRVSIGAGASTAVASGSATGTIAVPAVGEATIVRFAVTAASGAAKPYTFLLRQDPGTDVELSALATSAGALTPAFAPGTTAYAATVAPEVTSVTVTPTASAPDATLTVAVGGGAPAAIASGATSGALALGGTGSVTNVAVVVTGANGTATRTYTVAVTRQTNSIADLSGLTDSAGRLTGFATATLEYGFWVPYQAGQFRLTPTAAANGATIRIGGAVVASGAASAPIPLTPGGTTDVAVEVTAQDGVTVKTYTLHVSQGAAVGLVTPRVVPTTPSATLGVAAGAALPASGATEVPVDTVLRLGFDAPPALGAAGTVTIRQVTDDAVVDTLDVADPYAKYDGTPGRLTSNQTSSKVNVIGGVKSGIDQVRVVNYVPIRIEGNTVTIYPHNNRLAFNTAYYVTVDDGLLVGLRGGAAFTGFAGPTGWTFTTKTSAPTTYHVAADNSADFATVQGAIDAVPVGNRAPITISIAPGVYHEQLWLRNKWNVTLQGADDQGLGVVIQYDNCDGFNPGTGSGQSVTTPGPGGTLPAGNLQGGGRSVMLTGNASGLVLDRITLKSLHAQGSRVIPTVPAPTDLATTEPPTYVNYTSSVTQSEVLYFNTDFSVAAVPTDPLVEPGQLIARRSNFVSYQDTLQLKGWAWFHDCFVTGDVDFIWGVAAGVLFERCEIKTRNNPNHPSIVQSRANLDYGTATTAPASPVRSYPGFVFLHCALTKEAGDFDAFLARTGGPPSTSAKAPYTVYNRYDTVAFVDCSMERHVAAAGWNYAASPADLNATPIYGWREYRSFSPAGTLLDVGARPPNPFGSIQLTDQDAETFFRDRATVFGGATDGTYTTRGYPGGWDPQP